MEKKHLITPARIIFCLLSLTIMAVIFTLSCENADDSSETSGFFTNFIVRCFVRNFDSFAQERQDEIYGNISFIIRKCAHFSAYAALGFCTSCTAGRRRLFTRGSLIAWGICILYACSDELHQHFVPGRSCELRDVMIDSCGALTGLLVSMLAMAAAAHFIRNKHKKKTA
ncbi:MAG: VanZ family protein [Ruminococcus sp.]|nr:VanZ family protein [Ruminococcus sp.]